MRRYPTNKILTAVWHIGLDLVDNLVSHATYIEFRALEVQICDNASQFGGSNIILKVSADTRSQRV